MQLNVQEHVKSGIDKKAHERSKLCMIIPAQLPYVCFYYIKSNLKTHICCRNVEEFRK